MRTKHVVRDGLTSALFRETDNEENSTPKGERFLYRDDRPVSLKCSTTDSSLMPSSAGVEAEPVAEAKTGPVTAVLSLYLLEERNRCVGLCLRFKPDDWMVAPFSVNVVS